MMATMADAHREDEYYEKVAPASDKAIKYLVDLAREKTPHVAEVDIRRWAVSVDRSLVSEKIDWLKGMDNVSPIAKAVDVSLTRHRVPAGRYAVTGEAGRTAFITVTIPKDGRWAGRIFVRIQAGDSELKTSRAAADTILGNIAAAGVKESMLRYGREIGRCGHCHRTLTNEESRAAGIGPVCRENLGW